MDKPAIFIPIFDYLVFETMDGLPTADEVAAAIVAASAETGAKPEAVAAGAAGNRYHPEVTRARAYAAFALRAVFEKCSAQSISKWCGSQSPAAHLSMLDIQLRAKALEWWDDKTFMRVISAVETQTKARTKYVATDHVTLRRPVAREVYDVTASLMGDPPRDRSALADRLDQ